MAERDLRREPPVRNASPGRPPAPVLPGGHRLPALLLLLLLAAAAPLSPAGLPSARAQDGKEEKGREGPKEKGKEGGKEEEKGEGKEEGKEKEGEGGKRKRSAEERLVDAVAAEWKAGDVKALAARLPEKRRVSLRLPGAEAGEYRAEQARSVLEGYFEGRRFSRVEVKAVKEMTGTLEVEYLRTGDRRKVAATLLVFLGTEGERRVLVGARETP